MGRISPLSILFSQGDIMLNLFILGVGGFLGAVSRYLVSGYVQDLFKTANFPYGTMVVNILGCFILGLLTQIIGARSSLIPRPGFS